MTTTDPQLHCVTPLKMYLYLTNFSSRLSLNLLASKQILSLFKQENIE